MKRIGIIYAGRDFSIGESDFERMRETIDAAQRTGVATWITVNHGEGRPQPAELLVGPGIPIVLMPIPADAPTTGEPEEFADAGELPATADVEQPAPPAE
jgi:hypothetical protein